MAETAFDRTERGLGSTDLSVADIVAKTRGNPQQIMQLVMGGQINLTQGLLAKRLADSVVAEQQKAAMPTTTVLQDAFPQAAPPQQAPTAPPMQAPQGMGPVPGAPQMPPMQQMQAPPGMAEGGLAQLDFAAPDYAGGGMVSFDAGGEISSPEEWGAFFERRALEAIPGLEVSGRGRTAARNREVGGVAGSYHLIGAARDFRPPPGMSQSQLVTQLRSIFGEGYDILPSGGRSVHVEPGPALGRAVRAGTPFNPANVANLRTAPAAGAAAPATGNADIMAQIAAIGTPTQADPAAALAQVRAAAPTSTEDLEAYRAALGEVEDPEKVRKRAELGALFQAIGGVRPGMNPLEALAQGFAGTGASLQAAEERGRERRLEQLRAVADIERMQNQMTREEFQLATQLAQAEAGRLDAASARQLAARLQLMDAESRERIALASNNIAMLDLEQRGELGREQLRITEEGQIADYEADVYGGGSQPSAADQYLLSRLGSLGFAGPGMTPAPARAPAPSYEQVVRGATNGGGNTLDFSNLPR